MIVLSLTLSIGGHWGIMQSVAWGKMMYDFSQESTFWTAVSKTFSGDNPCDICRFVADGKKQEQSQQMVQSKIKFDLINQDVHWALERPDIAPDQQNGITFAWLALGPPDFPPPRYA